MCEAALCRALGLPGDTGRGELIAELRELAAYPRVALARLEEFAGWLTIGLVNVVNMRAPELVVLGDLLTALPEPVLDAVAAQVRERSMVSRASGTPGWCPSSSTRRPSWSGPPSWRSARYWTRPPPSGQVPETGQRFGSEWRWRAWD